MTSDRERYGVPTWLDSVSPWVADVATWARMPARPVVALALVDHPRPRGHRMFRLNAGWTLEDWRDAARDLAVFGNVLVPRTPTGQGFSDS